MTSKSHECDDLCDCKISSEIFGLTIALLIVELLAVLFTMSDGVWFQLAAPILIFNIAPLICLLIYARCLR